MHMKNRFTVWASFIFLALEAPRLLAAGAPLQFPSWRFIKARIVTRS